jgi:hypothetical protein
VKDTPEGVIEGEAVSPVPATEDHLPLLAGWFGDPEFVSNWADRRSPARKWPSSTPEGGVPQWSRCWPSVAVIPWGTPSTSPPALARGPGHGAPATRTGAGVWP